MKSIQTELGAIKDTQGKQEAEREKVLKGLKVVEALAKRMEHVEERQDKQDQQIAKHDDVLRKNSQKAEEGERKIKKLEDRMEKVEKTDQSAFDMRQCNAVAREVREMEKREKNVIFFNVPEAKEGEEDEGKKADWLKVKKILQELGLGEIQPIEARRIGKTGKYPRKIQLILATREECKKIVKKGRDGLTLADNIFLTRDRTFHQRQEARLFRMEKEKEEEEETTTTTQPERGRGRGRGRPRGRGNVGRGRGSRTTGSESRKRRNSGDEGNGNDDDESKRRRTGNQNGGAAMGGGEEPGGASSSSSSSSSSSASNDVATPATPVPDSELGAVGGADPENF